MKILFTFYLPSGGMETLNRIRCVALQNIGIECHLLYAFDAAGRHNIRHTVTHISNDSAAIHLLIQSEQYDAVVVSTDFHLMETIRASGFTKPIVYEIQGLGSPESAHAILQQAAPYVTEHANALLYPRTAHLISLTRSYFPSKFHFCFDNPLNSEQFTYSHYPKNDRPVIAWVGRIEANKNWNEFIDIVHRLTHTVPDFHVWMFGNASLNEPHEQIKFEAKIATLNLQDRIVQYSNIPHDQMDDYYSIIGDSGGFLCSTSISEGFGYAVAEAMICRCPVLSTDSDGVKSFILHAETGLFYSHGDIEQAIILAHNLMFDFHLRNHIRSSGEQHIKERFTPEKYSTRFLEMIHLLQQGS